MASYLYVLVQFWDDPAAKPSAEAWNTWKTTFTDYLDLLCVFNPAVQLNKNDKIKLLRQLFDTLDLEVKSSQQTIFHELITMDTAQLTWEHVCDTARAKWDLKRQLEISRSDSQTTVSRIDVCHPNRNTTNNHGCFRCGSKQHRADYTNCPALPSMCFFCNKFGHFARVCRLHSPSNYSRCTVGPTSRFQPDCLNEISLQSGGKEKIDKNDVISSIQAIRCNISSKNSVYQESASIDPAALRISSEKER
ncbi:unnamed protein product [Echinostoma caproni]|uniref:CCHC-type domain-containing protein n=1 Tax=Echinostoma caproni TaxID=27848 RepID=A0A183APB2_9TREM|nr:unnamed protein product [Echinostoma caproni]